MRLVDVAHELVEVVALVDEEGVVAARVALRFFGGELILDGFQGFLEAGRVDERQ